MMNLMRRIDSCLSIRRGRKTAVCRFAVLAVFAVACALALPAVTRTVEIAGGLDGIGVRVEAADGAIPADTALVLNRVLLPDSPEDWDGSAKEAPRRLTEYEAQRILAAAENGGAQEGKILEALDISLEYNGSEIEPADAVRLWIQSDLIRQARQPVIVHLDDEGNASLFIEVDQDGKTISFDGFGEESARESVDEISGMTDRFSVYALVDLKSDSQDGEETMQEETIPTENIPAEPFEFTGSAGTVDVYVTAPAAAFPAGTTMRLASVEAEEVMNTVSQAVGGEIAVVQAVDITFCDAEGVEIEPSEPINVVMRPHDTEIDVENSKLVHIGAEETTVVDNASFDEAQVTFDSDEFSTYAIIIILGAPGEHTYEGDGVTIKVSYGTDAGLPDGTEMTIRELEKGTEEYEEYFARTEKVLNLDTDEIDKENISLEDQFDFLFGDGYQLTDARIYDIELFHNGQKIEPAGPVNVEIHYDDADEVDAGNMKIVHFADDGTEIIRDLNVETDEVGATVSYQQGSFSQTAVVIAEKYGNGGWWYTTPYNANTPTYRLRFRYKDGIFELGYPGNYHAAGVKDNADWSWPGDPGYPFTGGAGQLVEGTTIEQILRALAEYGDPTYCSTVNGVDFLMYDTYTVSESNWVANGSRSIENDHGLQEAEVWTGEKYGSWDAPTGSWKEKSISINRVGNFEGPLIHINSKSSHPVHVRSNVVINNSASPQTAVLIENEALLMMEVNSYIIGSANKATAVGTGVYLDKGGSVEFFDNSFITNMEVAVEQKNGKTRLKTSPNPFGESNASILGMGMGNKTGVALWPGQSIGKWTEVLPAGMQSVPILLRDLDQWKSGDIVMDSGRWWYNELYPDGPHNEMYGAVVKEDLGPDKFYFQNPQSGVNMALEYYSGGAIYTNQTVTNYGGTNQVVAPGERYPVIRFTRGTVYNVNTNTWYKTLYDAVNGTEGMGPQAGRPVQSDDTLVFYGSTVEDKTITIPGTVTNLIIRTSEENEMPNDTRSGDSCTAEIQKGIVIESGASVTFQSGGAGDLTLSGSGADTIITNNGTLNLRDRVTVSGAARYGVDQNGTFNLYEDVTFSGNKAADVRLEADNKFITLQTTKPAADVSIELANQSNGRDVVVAGEENGVRETLDKGYLIRFPLTNLDADNYTYVYNETGGPNGVRALELKQKGSALIKITKVDAKDPDIRIQGVEFKIYDNAGNEYVAPITQESNPHITDENGETSITVRAGTYTVKETSCAPGYERGEVAYTFTVKENDDGFSLESDAVNAFISESDGTTFSLTVENTPKTTDVQFVKTDGTNPLADVTFALYEIDPATPEARPAYTGKSGTDGNIVWTNNNGENLTKLNFRVLKDYWLVETKTPAGYAPLPTTKITIKDDKNDGDYTVEAGDGRVTGGKEDDIVKITVVNAPGRSLPETGGIGTAVHTAVGLGLMGIAGLALLAVRIRRKGCGRA